MSSGTARCPVSSPQVRSVVAKTTSAVLLVVVTDTTSAVVKLTPEKTALCVNAVGYGMVPQFLRRREFRVAFLTLSQSARLLVFRPASAGTVRRDRC